ncbi:uncharacterized protein BDR25DRAFT_361780 [Lindgomyces ingoldianus]|uniref:Uncharacterized protein n=1 Tax=Lindgomyces ingoldianus TaxID=673940 RepID=A0ACB6QBK6_9PLEO|nr:uncharacterized protein BDR25DRAFT_361780 [Lindgomyces ingoldianus]KAF2464276.1 hypothetical protein BDR25DRAFT_361780 [Lindgomyces ingoldianus]
MLEHGTYMDEECMSSMKENGVVLIHTRTVIHEVLKNRNLLKTNPKKPAEASDQIALSADLDFLRLTQLVCAADSITPLTAIEAATVISAKKLGPQTLLSGLLKEGDDADIIAVDGNLLEDAAFLNRLDRITYVLWFVPTDEHFRKIPSLPPTWSHLSIKTYHSHLHRLFRVSSETVPTNLHLTRTEHHQWIAAEAYSVANTYLLKLQGTRRTTSPFQHDTAITPLCIIFLPFSTKCNPSIYRLPPNISLPSFIIVPLSYCNISLPYTSPPPLIPYHLLCTTKQYGVYNCPEDKLAEENQVYSRDKETMGWHVMQHVGDPRKFTIVERYLKEGVSDYFRFRHERRIDLLTHDVDPEVSSRGTYHTSSSFKGIDPLLDKPRDLRRSNELDTGANAAGAHYHEDARQDTSIDTMYDDAKFKRLYSLVLCFNMKYILILFVHSLFLEVRTANFAHEHHAKHLCTLDSFALHNRDLEFAAYPPQKSSDSPIHIKTMPRSPRSATASSTSHNGSLSFRTQRYRIPHIDEMKNS